MRRAVANAEEPRRAVAFVNNTARERPAVLTKASERVFAVEFAFHLLFEARYEGPLLVFGRVVVDTAVESGAEVRVVEQVRCNDPPDPMLVVCDEPNGQYTQRRTTVRILADFRHGNERQRVVPMALGEVRAGCGRTHTAGIGRRNVRGTVRRICPGRRCEKHSGSTAADELQTRCAKHFNSRFMSAEVTAPMV